MYKHMKTDVIGLRIDKETSTVVEKLIEFNMVKTKTDAVKFIMKHGIIETKKIIERKEESHKIIGKWKKEGFPTLPKDLSDLSIKERE